MPPGFEQQPDEWAAFRAPVSAVAVDRNSVYVTIVPGTGGAPARVSFELRVFPRRHACGFEDVTPDEVKDLSRVLRHVCGRVAKAVGDPSYELTLHTSPNLGVRVVQGEWETIDRDYHWHFELLVRPERAGGVSGIAVTDMLPEEAARLLREAGPVDGQGN